MRQGGEGRRVGVGTVQRPAPGASHPVLQVVSALRNALKALSSLSDVDCDVTQKSEGR